MPQSIHGPLPGPKPLIGGLQHGIGGPQRDSPPIWVVLQADHGGPWKFQWTTTPPELQDVQPLGPNGFELSDQSLSVRSKPEIEPHVSDATDAKKSDSEEAGELQKKMDPKLKTLFIQGQLLGNAAEALSAQIQELNNHIGLLMHTGSPLS